ncbi:hypothetical protein, partial [Micromonospora sp. NPDC051296]|uniref:hypothetical protein n=1 Tax=Micromonospora sp. NPDC051296 TaxID=3155046 RepID=UPI00341BC320
MLRQADIYDGNRVQVGNGELSSAGPQNAFELVITPDTRFARFLLRGVRRTSRLSGAVGLLLILTSIGTFTADGAW